jgi:hypothetical protein
MFYTLNNSINHAVMFINEWKIILDENLTTF